MSESKHVWVFLETEDGQLRSVGLALLGQGRLLADKMGEQLVGVILDPHAGTLAAQANDELCAMAKEESTQILNKVLRTASEQMKNGFSFADTCVNK